MVPHVDFIVGRGRKSRPGCLNFSLCPSLQHRNLVYIDSDPGACPDVRSELGSVDFTCFGIDKKQDPLHRIQIRIIFDVSSVFCGGIHSIHGIFTQLRRPFNVLIPLTRVESAIPSDIKRILWQPVYTLELVHDAYPMFDWSETERMCQYINPSCYVKVICSPRQSSR
jgi:hypothetical protein